MMMVFQKTKILYTPKDMYKCILADYIKYNVPRVQRAWL